MRIPFLFYFWSSVCVPALVSELFFSEYLGSDLGNSDSVENYYIGSRVWRFLDLRGCMSFGRKSASVNGFYTVSDSDMNC